MMVVDRIMSFLGGVASPYGVCGGHRLSWGGSEILIPFPTPATLTENIGEGAVRGLIALSTPVSGGEVLVASVTSALPFHSQ